MTHTDCLQELGLTGELCGTSDGTCGGELLTSTSPTDSAELGRVKQATLDDFNRVMETAQETFERWRMLPAPKRGEIVRQIGEELRKYKKSLGKLVSLEMGKILPEGEGEVQEMIDICDFAVGLSRQLYGNTMHSERAQHRMYEQWHPLGVVGVITAFNFPVAVWAWNAAIAMVCGNTLVWKPSSKTPLCCVAVHNIIKDVLKRNGWEGVCNYVVGPGSSVGDALLNHTNVKLISATGSTAMGYKVQQAAAKRLCRTILELGGNNAIVAMEDANMDLLVRATLFGAVGTAGQRCTSTRRLLVHESLVDEFIEKLHKSYTQVKIGNPCDDGVLMGPLIDSGAVDTMMAALDEIKKEGGEVVCGGTKLTDGEFAKGNFVAPTIVRAHKDMKVMQDETFAPILYVVPVKDITEAMQVHNNVPQGLSSAIFTNNMQYVEEFLSHRGSDCGIANVNIGTSGAEIGGAFGGEKDTGGGREAGSDSWKQYMRRQTNTINWGKDLPLAQGIKFE